MSDAPDVAGDATRSIALWDLPVRLVHWSFVVLMPALWWTAEKGNIKLHVTIGLIMLGLVLFRLVWGLVGSSTARFAGFVRGPASIRAYIASARAGTAEHVVGHNPLGALSVLGLLGLLTLQVGLGTIAQDTDAVASGPLNHLVSYDTAVAASKAHELVFNLILALIVLHIAAILFYRFVKQEKLVAAMITGRKWVPAGITAPRMAPLWRGLVVAVIAAVVAVWISWGVPPWGARWPWDKPPPVEGLSEDSYM
ncbi:cytochrome b/b6 domain-containing protein [Novosphingobium flavum]|uniref:Cytochrome b/b6 domain-containing protein n=1 Tax=Novosphingobium flavum TaxID=1778672 RepID=A0A7X1FTU7_9SPHN|nr:cytochrome b/b6 domain-containing protein [Novosphingobium flavum]MBC2666858.1 cytochrome b/b6 domain-containing protein [Novosphingobium flavum]